jgi:hypothetical protein
VATPNEPIKSKINEKIASRRSADFLTCDTRFDYIVCSIKESNNLVGMTIDELQSNLLMHEQRMKGHIEKEQILKVTSGEKFEAREDD